MTTAQAVVYQLEQDVIHVQNEMDETLDRLYVLEALRRAYKNALEAERIRYQL